MSASSKPSPDHHRPHHVVAAQHELAAPLDDTARVTRSQFLRPDAAAHTVPRLQNDHLVAGLRYLVRRQQAGEPGPHHHNPHAPLPPSTCPSGDTCHALKDATGSTQPLARHILR